MTHPLILPLDSPDATLAACGGKGVNLAKLARAGLPVPPGFVVTTDAYRQFVAAHDLQPFILATLAATDSDDPAALETASAAIRARFALAPIPTELAAAIVDAARVLTTDHRLPITAHLPQAVRSSATAEDLPDMSFAGQQDTFLNVVGDDALLEAVVACWSSLWTARAIAYRARNGIAQDVVALAVVVQAMVESEASGVLFTANPLTGQRGETVIDATLGLGEALVSGQVEPDHYEWTASGAGQTVESSTWTGQMSKGLRQSISFHVTGKRDECVACTCTASTNVFVDVHELSVTNGLYLGLDRTDCGRTNPVVKVAGAIIDPEPTGSSACLWTDCGI